MYTGVVTRKQAAIGQCSKDSRWRNESSLAHLETVVIPMERKERFKVYGFSARFWTILNSCKSAAKMFLVAEYCGGKDFTSEFQVLGDMF